MNLQPHLIGGRSSFTELSALGRRQAAALGRRLANELCGVGGPGSERSCHIWRMYSSTARRAVDTADIAAWEMASAAGLKVSDVPVPIHDEDLVEMSQGSWEGKDRSAVYTRETLRVVNSNNWLVRGPGMSPPEYGGAEGESPRTVEKRGLGFLHRLTSLAGSPSDGATERVVVVVAHGVTIKAALRGILGSNPGMTHKIAIDNTSITEVRYVAKPGGLGGWHLLRVNDASHLKDIR